MREGSLSGKRSCHSQKEAAYTDAYLETLAAYPQDRRMDANAEYLVLVSWLGNCSRMERLMLFYGKKRRGKVYPYRALAGVYFGNRGGYAQR